MKEIDISGVNLVDFAKKVYDLSSPQGMGFLHASNGDLNTEEAKACIPWIGDRMALRMDYVNGRACKMSVWREEDGRLMIDDPWYDHSAEDLDELLSHFNIKR